MDLLPHLNKSLIEAGCDEAGRGCLAGPVYAAAVVLPKNYCNSVLNDSKKLSEKQRYTLRDEILKSALSWAVGRVDNKEIDELNILRSSIKAMHIALNGLKIVPEFILVDGNYFEQYKTIPYKTIIKGDGKFSAIAAASILAKTYRDDYMKNLHKKYPVYLWNKNMGYPTLAHRQALCKDGLSPYHRKSFKLFDSQKKIDLIFD